MKKCKLVDLPLGSRNKRTLFKLSKKADEIEKMLCHKFSGFMMRRAESFRILRRKAIEGYDIRIRVGRTKVNSTKF